MAAPQPAALYTVKPNPKRPRERERENSYGDAYGALPRLEREIERDVRETGSGWVSVQLTTKGEETGGVRVCLCILCATGQRRKRERVQQYLAIMGLASFCWHHSSSPILHTRH